MTGTDLYANKPHFTAAAQCGLFTHKSVPVIFEPPCITISQNTTKIIVLCFTICFTTTCFGPFL